MRGEFDSPDWEYQHGVRKRKTRKPVVEMMIPGTTNDQPQLPSDHTPGIRAPRMLPRDVCEFHRPMTKPLLNIHSATQDMCQQASIVVAVSSMATGTCKHTTGVHRWGCTCEKDWWTIWTTWWTINDWLLQTQDRRLWREMTLGEMTNQADTHWEIIEIQAIPV